MTISIAVARAIGWTDIRESQPGLWRGVFDGVSARIPEYERNWCALGPMIDRLKIELEGQPWCLATWREYRGEGKTGPEAVCRLLLAMAAGGVNVNPLKEG